MFKRHRGLPTTGMLFARALCGGYLIYLAYQLLDGITQKEHQALMVIFAVLFLVVGAAALFFAARDVMKGNYQGGAMDFGEDTEAKQENAAEVCKEETPESVNGADEESKEE